MDNPWATPWDENQSSWSTGTSTTKWPAAGASGTVWQQGRSDSDRPWDSSTEDTTSEPDEPPSATDAASVSDHQAPRPTSPSAGSSDPVPDSTDAILHNPAPGVPVSVKKGPEATINPSDDGWTAEWGTTSPSEQTTKETLPPDQWEAARQEKEKLNRAVPPELLDSLLRHGQRVSQEIWPASEFEASDGGNWRSGFDGLSDIATLLAQLAPPDSTLPPTVQFSETATAKAMNEALKLTRNLPASASSPLSRLLASKGSLEWEKSIKAKQVVIPDTTHVAHVGWRVLEKEDRLITTEDSKPKKTAGSGLLSFWSRRVSTIQAYPIEAPRERSNSPVRSSVESVKSVSHPPSSRAASPSKTTPVVLPLPPTDPLPTTVVTAPAPSVVSRFLNRFSRAKGTQHCALAFSSDEIEFLSDIVPSASDSPDEDISGGALEALTSASSSSSLPPKLPPPIPPPPKQPVMSSHPSTLVDGMSMNGNATVQMQPASHASDIPVLAPPLSPRSADSFSHTQSPPLFLKDIATPIVLPGQSNAPIQQNPLQNCQASSRSHSPFALSLLPKGPPSLSIPPLLPPPPVSPPQTPRPSTFSPMATSDHSSAMRSNDTSFHDSYDSDDEFSAFASFPPSNFTPFPSSNPYPSKRSPSPPSPPPRRTYERTHYPSTSSTSSTLSPGSHTSGDQLYATGSLISEPLDSFDDFVSPPSATQGENKKHTPSPPPLPVKPQSQHRQPPRIDTYPTRVYHAHTPSQTLASPTVRTSLLNGASSSPTVSHAQHQRTQSLVTQAAARGGLLWPNSPDSSESKAMAIPPPPSSISLKPLIGEDAFDLLGDDNTFGGGLRALPAPLSVVEDIKSPSPPTSMLSMPFGVASSPGRVLGSRDQLQPSPPPLPSTSTPVLSFSSLSTHRPLASGSTQPAKPRQTGGLSAQDLSFFEGL